MVSVQDADVPEQSPSHLTNVEPESAIAVSMTDVVFVYKVSQKVPQLIPDGFELTVPEPRPNAITFKLIEGPQPCNSRNPARRQTTRSQGLLRGLPHPDNKK
jgi:hypothetical protein